MENEKLPLGAKIAAAIGIGLGILITQGLDSKIQVDNNRQNSNNTRQELRTSYTNQTALDFEFKDDHWFPDYTTKNPQLKYN